MKEDVNTVSPTLGFIIRTIDFKGYKLNIWDVGGQKTIRSYWRNYFEKTDALIWVVDATDRLRMEDCRTELRGLLLEEVCRIDRRRIDDYTDLGAAAFRLEFACILEQNGYCWRHECR